MVGSALLRSFLMKGYARVITVDRSELNLFSQSEVDSFFRSERPEVVINTAAKVGGILANQSFPYDFLMRNLQIQNNLIDSSLKYGVEKFIFLGSSCIYPKYASQPLKESSLLTGPLEPTNEWYAIAKISGVKACQAIRRQYGLNYHSLMPTNLYGRNDNFDLNSSHVLPAMLRKFHDAKVGQCNKVILWGSGAPRREFLYVDDLADAVVYALGSNLTYDLYNVGTGRDITIKDLAQIIQVIVGHGGEIVWDTSKPDGTPRKLLDVQRMKDLGWEYSTSLKDGIKETYQWFLSSLDTNNEIEK